MKRFKFWIVSVFVLLSGIVSFGYCDNMYEFPRIAFSLGEGDTFNFDTGTCIVGSNYGTELSFYNSNGDFVFTGVNLSVNRLLCLDFNGYIFSTSTTSHSFSYYSGFSNLFDFSCPECQECEECPEIDTNYCVENDLCPVPSNFSQLFINDIEHESAPLINVSIPEEFDWDSSIDSGQFNLDVVGYNVDTEYIDNIIRTQSTKPNDTDFNNIVSGLIPLLIPGLVIILFIYFVFRFIKKVF